jgi:hypothetical protein
VQKQPTAGPSNHQASVEAEEEPLSVIEAADGNDNIDPYDTLPELIYVDEEVEVAEEVEEVEEEVEEVEEEEEEEWKQETAEEELGNFKINQRVSCTHQFIKYRALAKRRGLFTPPLFPVGLRPD